LLTGPRSPTTTGKVERLHNTMRAEFFSDADRVFATIVDLRVRWLGGWSITTPSAHTSRWGCVVEVCIVAGSVQMSREGTIGVLDPCAEAPSFLT
jgi:hypothetical protein